MALEIETEAITDALGDYSHKSTLTLKPGEYIYLLSIANQKIYGNKITYVVRTPGKVSRWTCTSNGQPDVHGYFTVVFTPENLNAPTWEYNPARPIPGRQGEMARRNNSLKMVRRRS